jgi:putative phosphoribosyl transferase
MEDLSKVRSPSLFIVGGNDPEVEHLNRKAQRVMRCPAQVSIIPGAGHLFEEGRSLETVAGLAAGWFLRYFQERKLPGYHVTGRPPPSQPYSER